jgi:hypothetical protein
MVTDVLRVNYNSIVLAVLSVVCRYYASDLVQPLNLSYRLK